MRMHKVDMQVATLLDGLRDSLTRPMMPRRQTKTKELCNLDTLGYKAIRLQGYKTKELCNLDS